MSKGESVSSMTGISGVSGINDSIRKNSNASDTGAGAGAGVGVGLSGVELVGINNNCSTPIQTHTNTHTSRRIRNSSKDDVQTEPY